MMSSTSVYTVYTYMLSASETFKFVQLFTHIGSLIGVSGSFVGALDGWCVLFTTTVVDRLIWIGF